MIYNLVVFGLFFFLGSFKDTFGNEHPGFIQYSRSSAGSDCNFKNLQAPPDCNAVSNQRNVNQAEFSTCVLTETDLQHLVDLVTDAITAATTVPMRIQTRGTAPTLTCTQNCTLERVTTQPLRKNSSWKEGPCKEIYNTIESLLHRLTQSILPLVPLRLAITDPFEYCAFVAEMEEEMLSLRTTLCNLELSTSQNLTALREKLWEQERCYIYQLTCARSEIDELVDSLRNQRLLGLISLLQAGRMTDLWRELNYQNDLSLIGPLITGSYRVSTMEYISQFVDLLSDSTLSYNRYVAYNATLYSMLAAGHHTTNVVFLLKRMVDTETHQHLEGMAAIKRLVDGYATRLIYWWAVDIRANNFRAILEFGSPPIENRAGLSFLHILPELLDEVFGEDEKNLVPLLRFVAALRWNRHKGVSLIELDKLFVKTGSKIQIALLVKNTINGNLNGPDTQYFHFVNTSLTNLKRNFPTVVKNVVFSTRCRLNSSGNFLTTGWHSDGQDFIQTPTATTTGSSTEWQFEPVYSESRGEHFFRIKSQYGEYLGADFFWNTLSTGYAPTVTSPLEPCGDERFYGWKVEGVDGPETNRIQLYHLGRLLYLWRNELMVDKQDGITLSCVINTD